jgi:formyltetrahydrofolate hydrolase
VADSLPFDRRSSSAAPIAERFASAVQLTDSANPKRVVVLVSRQDHCSTTCCIASSRATSLTIRA